MELYPNNFSIWCDFIERDFLEKEFPDMLESGIVSGITSNPIIFKNAIKSSKSYDEDKKNTKGLTPQKKYEQIAIKDIQKAADILMQTYETSDDGFVSIEVSPNLANNAIETIKEGIRLFDEINKQNVMIKIPATEAGYEAIEELISRGINVNATLVFSPKQARGCLKAIERGNKNFLEKNENKKLPSAVISVFVSRFDRKLDNFFDGIKIEKMQFGIMNAAFIYQDIENAKLPNVRCLFASTGVSDKNIDGTYYIKNLLYKNAINTAPVGAIKALIENFDFKEATPPKKVDILKFFSHARIVGVDIEEVYDSLMKEGLKQFEDAFSELLSTFDLKDNNNTKQRDGGQKSTIQSNENFTVKNKNEIKFKKVDIKEDSNLSVNENRLRRYLSQIVNYGGSDLHIKANSAARGRVNGEIIIVDNAPFFNEDLLQLAKDILKTRYEEFNKKKNLDFMYKLNDDFRFRVNIYYQVDGISAAFRTIPTNLPTVEQLELPEVINSFSTLQRGLVLVTGPTGSGKSTTLATMLNYINQTSQRHIITIEDPVEFIYKEEQSIINQRAIGESAITFPDALRASLREDPDVIMVGEMRDLETIRTALQAAETGHLVLSTLHTIDTKETISRIISMFEGSEQIQVRKSLSSVLQAIISQRLVRRRGGGRIAAIEIMVKNARIETLIADKRENEIKDAIEEGRKVYKSQSFNQALLDLYASGTVNYHEALRAATSVGDLKILLDNHDALVSKKNNPSKKVNSDSLKKGESEIFELKEKDEQ